MTDEISNFFNINIEIDGNKKQQMLVTNNTLIENIRNKIDDNIELIFNGNILDNHYTIGDLNITNYDCSIYAFYSVEPKAQNLINIFQDILEHYIHSNTAPINHYNNIFNTIMNINSNIHNSSDINNNIRSYDNELEILTNMGFSNNQENLLLLRLYNGDINQVTNILLEQ